MIHEWRAKDDVTKACLTNVLFKFRHIATDHQGVHSIYTAVGELFVIALAESDNATGKRIDKRAGWEAR